MRRFLKTKRRPRRPRWKKPPRLQLRATWLKNPRSPLWKRKKFLLIAAGALVLLAAPAGWWLLKKPPPPPEPEPEPAPAPEPTPPPEPPKPVEPPPPPEQFATLDPFLVEKTDDKGVTRLLTVRIKLIYTDPSVGAELKFKLFSVRDALYHNLKNKPFGIFADLDNTDTLRDELRGVVNNYLSRGQIEKVLFDEILVK